jgi:hypothetical protein
MWDLRRWARRRVRGDVENALGPACIRREVHG